MWYRESWNQERNRVDKIYTGKQNCKRSNLMGRICKYHFNWESNLYCKDHMLWSYSKNNLHHYTVSKSHYTKMCLENSNPLNTNPDLDKFYNTKYKFHIYTLRFWPGLLQRTNYIASIEKHFDYIFCNFLGKA